MYKYVKISNLKINKYVLNSAYSDKQYLPEIKQTDQTDLFNFFSAGDVVVARTSRPLKFLIF